DERVTSLCQRVGGQVLELADLVAAVGEPRVAVLSLRPDLDLATEMLGESAQRVDGRGTEEQLHPVEIVQTHASTSARSPSIVCLICSARARSPRVRSAGVRPNSSSAVMT